MPQPARRVYESGPTGFDLQRKLAEAGLKCLHGVPAVTAFSVAAEVGGLSRFPTARSFMSFVGVFGSVKVDTLACR